MQDYEGLPVLEKQYLQIDVEIAHQYVLLREKEARMRSGVAILAVSDMFFSLLTILANAMH